jgi:HAD superfamily hydrolase (TIGR01484 family)
VLIATDLDGTLVPNASKSIPPYTAEVLERVDDAGIPVVFVTGRPLRWMETLWPHIGKHGLAVVSNGAVTYNVHEREVVTTTGIRQDSDFVERDRVPAGSRRGPLADIWDRTAVKLLVRHETLDHDEFRDRVIAAVGDLANATWSIPGLVEISAAGVTKASALVGLCERLGVEGSEVVAFGDMPNDIPMLEWAGTSYAVANAHESVLAVADHIAPSYDEEGVAQVMQELLEGGGASPL